MWYLQDVKQRLQTSINSHKTVTRCLQVIIKPLGAAKGCLQKECLSLNLPGGIGDEIIIVPWRFSVRTERCRTGQFFLENRLGILVFGAMVLPVAGSAPAHGRTEPPGASLYPSLRGLNAPVPTLERYAGAKSSYKIKRLAGGTVRFIHAGFVADVKPDGTVRFRDHGLGLAKGALGVRFDLTDMLMRMKGQCIYSSYKIQFLKETAAWRVQLQYRWKGKLEKESLNHLRRRLAWIWHKSGWPANLRRKKLYLIWRDCLSRGRSPGAGVGQSAREMITSFIRRNLPRRSPLSYTAAELAAFARDKGGAGLFVPYKKIRKSTSSRPRHVSKVINMQAPRVKNRRMPDIKKR